MSEAATRPAFHLAIAVRDIETTRRFYVEVLGCRVGRSAERWIDFDFFGHQVSAHLVEEAEPKAPTNDVDGYAVPVRHFGVVLAWDEWHAVLARLERAGVSFLVPPHVRFRGEPGEQATVFFRDPSGNALELKSFRDPSRLFAADP